MLPLTILTVLKSMTSSLNLRTRRQVYSIKLLLRLLGLPKDEILSYLKPETLGKDNKVTAARWVKSEIKYHRARSVHVTPTVFFNDLEATQISSGWTLEQWSEFLDPFTRDASL